MNRWDDRAFSMTLLGYVNRDLSLNIGLLLAIMENYNHTSPFLVHENEYSNIVTLTTSIPCFSVALSFS